MADGTVNLQDYKKDLPQISSKDLTHNSQLAVCLCSEARLLKERLGKSFRKARADQISNHLLHL